MLQILVLALVSTSSAFTTHRYDIHEGYANHHPVLPLKDNVHAFGNSNGRRPVKIYVYSRRHDGVKLSDNVLNQAPVYNSDDGHRRVDTQYSYQHPYQRSNGQGTWNGVAVTEPASLYNQLHNSNYDQRYPPVHTTVAPLTRKSVQQEPEATKYGSKLNKTRGNENVTHINTQLNYVNRTLVRSEQQITWNNDQHKQEHIADSNANKTIRSITSVNNTNSLQLHVRKNDSKTNGNGSNYFNPVKFNSNSIHNSSVIKETQDKYHPANTNNRTNNKTNKFNVNTNTEARNQPNYTVIVVNNSENVNNNTYYGKKTTQDNEVTPRTEKKEEEEDRWIWSNGEEHVESTTLFDLDDRAAFTGDGCPDGKVKFGNACVTPD